MLILMAPHSVAQNDLPSECKRADFSTIGRPVVFELRTGLSLGISTSITSFSVDDPITLSVWAVNQTDTEQWVASCSEVEWWTWDLQVYDSQKHARERRGEKEEQHNPALKLQHELRKCYRNVALRVAPRSCSPLYDNDHVITTDLTKRYDLPPGNYLVTQKRSTPPTSGLSIVVGEKKRSVDVPTR